MSSKLGCDLAKNLLRFSLFPKEKGNKCLASQPVSEDNPISYLVLVRLTLALLLFSAYRGILAESSPR